MSAEIPFAASECIMPTWMAPKLPPPAKTKAVLRGPAGLDPDKVCSAPGIDAVAGSHAISGRAYSSRETDCIIKSGCGGSRPSRGIAQR